MSEINRALPCRAPPEFPENGRLFLTPEQITANYRKLTLEERQFSNKLMKQAGKRLMPPCCHSLHISLFFDGTGNNDENDTNMARPPHPTNIARLFHATYPTSGQQQGYFSYYMPGVGTPFPKINEFAYSSDGLKYALGGEDRINWAMLRLVDALMIAITPTRMGLSDSVAREQIVAMRAHWPLSGEANRRRAIDTLLQPLRARVVQARPQPIALKLFIYGFSRGAAEARAFASWLSELCVDPVSDNVDLSLLGLPLSIEFLGLLDTVPSVGIARLIPGFDGHMSWASDTQQLPLASRFPGLIKCCHHFIAAHEQRLSFPLDSVRRPEGHYPANTSEVVYPGVHSDVGGGYPPGDQGKSCGSVGEMLSQIVLHDLYAAAFDAGAPLAVRPDRLTPLIETIQPLREMSQDSITEFAVAPVIINRFNAWRKLTLLDGAASQADIATAEQYGYQPLQLTCTLENAIIRQMAWMTAWRIGRYAHNSLLTQPFYLNAPQKDAVGLEEDKNNYDMALKKFRHALKNVRRDRPNWQDSITPGPPDYEPTTGQYQLREGAREFEHDYRNWFHDINGSPAERVIQVALDGVLKHPVYLLNGDDENNEYEQMRKEGDYYFGRLFSDRLGTNTRKEPEAQVLALFDEHIHDSRAWFMQSTLGGREPWSGYFRYRMIYCGDKASKQTRLIYLNGQVMGARQVSGSAEYIVESRVVQGGITEAHKVRELASGKTEILSPGNMLPFSNQPVLNAARESARISAEHHHQHIQLALMKIKSEWNA